jgi:predicted short-subunit dehydrogenase-like oxidoreductase (DUF2520 family)
MNIVIVGAGRAGTSFEQALRSAGHSVRLVHHDEASTITGADLVLLCVPDDAIAEVAATITASDDVVVAHAAGSRTLSELSTHRRVASIHPLVVLSSTEVGAPRLVGATYCVAGDALAHAVVASLGGRIIRLRDDQRTIYHAAAVVASNHLVALMGQVKHLAESIGLDVEDFIDLARQSLLDVRSVGPEAALTGPASRGDLSTIDAHLTAMDEADRSAYVAMANAAFDLAERRRSQLPA